MLNGKTIAVVLAAYNAEKTLEATVRELPDIVDVKILVDDFSSDQTVKVARTLGISTYVHAKNYGYGRNQMTCYHEALAAGAGGGVLLHPPHQEHPPPGAAMAPRL